MLKDGKYTVKRVGGSTEGRTRKDAPRDATRLKVDDPGPQTPLRSVLAAVNDQGGPAIRNQARTPHPISFVVLGEPIAKPRMTRQDKWMKRKCVVTYREWANKVKAACPPLPVPNVWNGFHLTAHFYLSCPKRRKADRPHDVKPDLDNLLKGVLDAILPKDQVVNKMTATKAYADCQGPRVLITLAATEAGR